MSTPTKSLVYVLVALAVAAGVLWFVGGQKREYQTQVSINANPSQIYPFLYQPDYVKQWSTEVLEISPHGNVEGELGATADVILDVQGQKIQLVQEIIKFQRDQMITLQRVNEQQRSIVVFRLEPKGDQTELTYKVKESRLSFNRLLGFLRKDRNQQRINEEILELKKLVQSASGLSGQTPSQGSLQEQVDRHTQTPSSTGEQQNQPDEAFRE